MPKSSSRQTSKKTTRTQSPTKKITKSKTLKISSPAKKNSKPKSQFTKEVVLFRDQRDEFSRDQGYKKL